MTNSIHLTRSPDLKPTLESAGARRLYEAIQALDLFVGGAVPIVDRDLDTPPGSPANGDAYVVATGGTGTWSGQDGNLAYWLTDYGSWQFATPWEGLIVRVIDEGVTLLWDGAAFGVVEGSQVGFVIALDGGGSPISTGVKHYFEVPLSMTVTGWTLVADQSGSIVVDLWKDVFANFPPTVADTITGTEKPTLSAAQSNQDLALSSWTTAVTRGDILGVNVDSASTVTKAWLTIRGTRVA